MNIEHLLHPIHIKKDIKQYILDNYIDDINLCTDNLVDYCNTDHWESKNNRLSQLENHQELILNILTTLVLIADDYIPLVNVCCAIEYPNMDKAQSIQTNADILHCMDITDLIIWDITHDNKRIIKHGLELPESILSRIYHQCVLPPITYKPRKLIHNNSSALKTVSTSKLILGDKENYHDKCISLDVLNTLNRTAYKLDLSVCSLDTDKEHESTKEQFEYFVEYLDTRSFHFTHAVDKRGRVYSKGYHFNTQGTSFDKACLTLAVTEYVKGDL